MPSFMAPYYDTDKRKENAVFLPLSSSGAVNVELRHQITDVVI